MEPLASPNTLKQILQLENRSYHLVSKVHAFSMRPLFLLVTDSDARPHLASCCVFVSQRTDQVIFPTADLIIEQVKLPLYPFRFLLPNSFCSSGNPLANNHNLFLPSLTACFAWACQRQQWRIRFESPSSFRGYKAFCHPGKCSPNPGARANLS
jgi:hypothetical protein